MAQDFPHGQVKSNDESSMSGYLYKKTKDGRWQKRWFETNGIYLTYYKSKKMEKLLAALSLPQVGEIKMLSDQEETGLFSIELNTRIYTLRAKTDDEAALWVKSLNKLREQGISTSSVNLTEKSSDKDRLPTSMEDSKSDWMKTGKKCGICC